MLLRPCNPSCSANLSYGYSPPLPPKRPTLSHAFNFKQNSPSSIVTFSISQVHSYGTVDHEENPSVNWTDIYKKICMMEKPDLGPATVLYQFEAKGKKLNKWELCRVVKELRKHKRYKQALEVYEWMNHHGDRFRLTSSDAAIQLDLISKVHGVPIAEHFFTNLPKPLKDRRIYAALLNAYTRARMKTKAESLFSYMREKEYSNHSLSFNVMMTLYMNLNEYDKVDAMVSEMKEKKIQLDLYSYNIWFSSYGYRGSPELLENAFQQMKLDKTIVPNWSTFSTLATMYIKMGFVEKAGECLKKVESRITGRDRAPYHYLMSLYSSLKNKDEVYRVWEKYKSTFPTIPNLGYRAVISALIRAGDMEGAETIYEEWLLVKPSYDPRIVNVLMTGYVKEGEFEKAEDAFKFMVEEGGKPISSTWEILAERHLAERSISEALSCYTKALSIDETKTWKPRSVTVSMFFNLCKEEGQIELKERLVDLLRQSGLLKDRNYVSEIGLSGLISEDRVLEQSNEVVIEYT